MNFPVNTCVRIRVSIMTGSLQSPLKKSIDLVMRARQLKIKGDEN
jgi:hypothetical protein